jgi:hypothetical protein
MGLVLALIVHRIRIGTRIETRIRTRIGARAGLVAVGPVGEAGRPGRGTQGGQPVPDGSVGQILDDAVVAVQPGPFPDVGDHQVTDGGQPAIEGGHGAIITMSCISGRVSDGVARSTAGERATSA